MCWTGGETPRGVEGGIIMGGGGGGRGRGGATGGPRMIWSLGPPATLQHVYTNRIRLFHFRIELLKRVFGGLTLPGLCKIWGTKAGLIVGGGEARTGGTAADKSYT